MKIRTGDTVVIISGKDKGKTGTVLRVLPATHRIVVSDANMRTRHVRKTPQRAGQIVRYEASIHVSNVMLIDPKTKKRTRVGYTVDAKGKKRVAKRSGEVLVGASKTSAKTTKKKSASSADASTEGAEKETAKKTKAAPKKAPSQPATGASDKTPFWKKLGFGDAAIEQTGDIDEPSRMQQDHSVPSESHSQSTRSHQRGS